MSSFLPLHMLLPKDLAVDAAPWIPSSVPGKSSRPLRFLDSDRGFVELLRMEPGVTMPLHRHTGEVHVYQLSGSRQLGSGELVGPGDYAYEPAGNVDEWWIVGDEAMVALVVVMGDVEFLAADGTVCARANARTQWQAYRDFCTQQGLPLLDLAD